MLALWRARFHDELVADFQQFYHLDLEGVRPSRAAILSSQLPRKSRLMMRVDASNSWGVEDHLLANIADGIEALRYEQRMGKGQKPKPIERPYGSFSLCKKPYISKQHLDDLLFSPRG